MAQGVAAVVNRRQTSHPLPTMVNAKAHRHTKPPWLAKERFVAGAAAAMSVTGGLILGIRLRFHFGRGGYGSGSLVGFNPSC